MTDNYEPDWSGSRRSERTGPKKGTFWILPLVGLACVLIFFLAVNLREPVPGTTLQAAPPEALGRWTTTDARYLDRGMIIGPRDFVLELGPDDLPVTADIVVVSTWPEDKFTVVHIEYDAGEGVMEMDMMFPGDGTMRLRNPRDVIWTRAR